MRRHALHSLCALTLVFAGCGGGGDPAPTTSDTADVTPEPDVTTATWGADADAEAPDEPDVPVTVEDTPEPPEEVTPPEPDIAPDVGPADVAPEVDKPNNPPVAVDDHSATFAGEPVHVEVRRNDSDPDDDEISIVAVTDGEFGTVTVNDGGIKVGERVTYTPTGGGTLGLDSFTYTIEDPDGAQASATVTIHQVQVQDDPYLAILSPQHGEVIDADTFTVSFEAAGCYFTSPSVDPEGCHGHKWVDGEKWSALSDDTLGHYNTATFEIGPLTDGLHVFEFVLHDNAGSDAAWDPEITAEVTVEITGGYVPPDKPVEAIELAVPIATIQASATPGELLVGTTAGLYRTQGGSTVQPVIAGPSFSALARDPFSATAHFASGMWPAMGFDLWGLAASNNEGQSWSEVSLQNVAMFEDIAVATDQPGVLAGVWAAQAYVSQDGGANWDTKALDLWFYDLIFASSDPVVLLLAGVDGVQSMDWASGEMTTVVDGDVRCIDRIGQQIAYVTADGTITLCDETLTDCTSSPTPSSDIVVQMTSEMADPNVMYLLTDQSQVFLSEDGGETWELLIDGGP